MKRISKRACKDEVVSAILSGTERGYIQRTNSNKYKICNQRSLMNLLSQGTPKEGHIQKKLNLGSLMSRRRSKKLIAFQNQKSPVKGRPKKSKVIAKTLKRLGMKGAKRKQLTKYNKRKSLVKNSPRKRQKSGRKKGLSKNLKRGKKRKIQAKEKKCSKNNHVTKKAKQGKKAKQVKKTKQGKKAKNSRTLGVKGVKRTMCSYRNIRNKQVIKAIKVSVQPKRMNKRRSELAKRAKKNKSKNKLPGKSKMVGPTKTKPKNERHNLECKKNQLKSNKMPRKKGNKRPPVDVRIIVKKPGQKKMLNSTTRRCYDKKEESMIRNPFPNYKKNWKKVDLSKPQMF